jgi:RND family efflux transporter MFP subunit
MTRNKKLLIAGLAVLVGLGAVYALRPKASATVAADPSATTQSAAALTVAVVTPQKSVWPIEIQANGWLTAWQEVVISAQVGGQMITSVNAEVGDTVAENTVLSELSTGSLTNQIIQLEASVESAKASLDLASADAERARQLSGGSSISQQQAAEYFATERKAKADVDSAEAQLASARLDLAHTKITAVTGGIISSRSAAIGNVVSAGQELFRMVRDGRVEWQAEVPLNQLRSIKVGMPVSIPTPIGDVAGEVRRIAPTASESNGRVIVYVSLIPPKGIETPKTGIMISGKFKVGSREALSVPSSAVVMQDGFSYVFAVNPDGTSTVSRLRVETGRRQADRIEITSELAETAQVVQAGGAFLSDGSVVRVVPAEADTATSDTAPASAAAIPEVQK